MLFYYIAFFIFSFSQCRYQGQGIHGVVQNSATNNGNVVMMVQPGGATNGTGTGTVSPSIQRIPLPGKFLTKSYLLFVIKQIYTYLNFHEFDIINNRTRITRRRASLRKCKTISQNSQTAPSSRKTRSRG